MPNAVAPYNFVPMSDRIVEGDRPPDADRYYTDRYTGWFDISVTARTPIYTRGARPAGTPPGTDVPEFFARHDGKYALPGSSMRGMVRSIFEIITYSGMEFVSPRQLFYRSFADSVGNIRKLYTERFRKEELVAGLLVRASGKLLMRVSNSSPCGFSITRKSGLPHSWITRGKDVFPEKRPVAANSTGKNHGVSGLDIADVDPSSSSATAWLIVPGPDIRRNGAEQRTWFQVIWMPTAGGFTDYEVPPKVYDDYLAWGAMAHGKRFDEVGKNRKSPRRLIEGEPAFGLPDPKDPTKLSVLGANMMMPMRYDNSIYSVCGRSLAGELPDLDMAQAVFGRVRTEKKSDTDQIRGRVFFEDAVCMAADPSEVLLDSRNPKKTPTVLSGPKPTAFQIYLKQPQGSTLDHWDSSGAQIAGRKLYWHRSAAAAKAKLNEADQDKPFDKQSTIIQPLRPGVVFEGRIRFENLNAAELGALYASVRLPDGMAHKFGMAKNLGLGSIRVDVTRVALVDHKARFRSLDLDAGLLSREAAESEIANTYAAFVNKVLPKSKTLWGNQRMLALASLLSWNIKPDDSDTEQAEMGSDQWKYRWVLPMPQRVSGIQGAVDVCSLTTVTAPDKDSKSVQRAPVDTRVYRTGEKVSGRVTERDGLTGQGRVQLLDGTSVKAISLYTCRMGEAYSFKVTKVDNSGAIKEVTR